MFYAARLYHRIGTVPADELRPRIQQKLLTPPYRLKVMGKLILLNGPKYRLLANTELECARCGLRAEYFAVECPLHDPPGASPNYHRHKYHLNLYAEKADGTEEQFTLDHIWPKSKGGDYDQKNLQLLCYTCNQKKADLVGVVFD
jgi:hypothetical protein